MTSAADKTFLGHPKGLGYIVFTEVWERFSFYGMQALLVLYMATYLLRDGVAEQVLGYETIATVLRSIFGDLSVQAMTAQIFGLYVGLVFLTPVVGGYLGDRYLGRVRAVLWGAALMALGHFLLALESMFFPALLLLILGSGLLKGNLAAQVGALYEKNDQRRDAAFTLYNVAVTLGATLAPLVCGTLGERYGWHYGFGAAGIGMLLGAAIYIAGRRYLPDDSPGQHVQSHDGLQKGDGRTIAAILSLLPIAALFWAGQTQVWNSYPLWVRDRVDRLVGDFSVPVTWFQSVDAGAALILAPLVLWVWSGQRRRGKEPEDLHKLALGFVFVAAAFAVLTMAEWRASEGGGVAMLWPLIFHFLLGLGFLFIGPVLMSLISRAAPVAVNATLVSCYYLSIFIGGFLSGWLGRFYEPLGPAQFWLLHMFLAVAGLSALLTGHRYLSRVLASAE